MMLAVFLLVGCFVDGSGSGGSCGDSGSCGDGVYFLNMVVYTNRSIVFVMFCSSVLSFQIISLHCVAVQSCVSDFQRVSF